MRLAKPSLGGITDRFPPAGMLVIIMIAASSSVTQCIFDMATLAEALQVAHPRIRVRRPVRDGHRPFSPSRNP
jgi:hypothetical protein